MKMNTYQKVYQFGRLVKINIKKVKLIIIIKNVQKTLLELMQKTPHTFLLLPTFGNIKKNGVRRKLQKEYGKMFEYTMEKYLKNGLN